MTTESTRQYERQPFRNRESIMACDVSEAIKLLVTAPLRAPLALDRSSIADQLVILAHRQPDGTVDEIRPIVQRTLFDSFIEQLSGGVFRVGYKAFEETEKIPVVPVTDYFFQFVYTEDRIRDGLGWLTEDECRQSLPKRASRVRDPNSRAFMRDDDDEFLVSGSVAGIVLFPPNHESELLTQWLQRRSKVAVGLVNSAVTAIEHARPDAKSVAALTSYTRGLGPTMREALPEPKKEETPTEAEGSAT